jgi:hypothetical protein
MGVLLAVINPQGLQSVAILEPAVSLMTSVANRIH